MLIFEILICRLTLKYTTEALKYFLQVDKTQSSRLTAFFSACLKQLHNIDSLIFTSLISFFQIVRTQTEHHFFGAEACGKTKISLSAFLHCWGWTNEWTTAARVTQWQTAYSATSSVAAPQGPGSDLFPELHLSLSLPLLPLLLLLLLTSSSFPDCLSPLISAQHDSIKCIFLF